MKEPTEIGVGLLGVGVVGSSVAEALTNQREWIASQVGKPLGLSAALVRTVGKARPFALPPDLLTTEASEVIEDPRSQIIIELMGGESPAYDYVKRAISLGKHVVTANKEVMAKHGAEILELARERGVHVLFEASVGGGIPVIGPLVRDLSANNISTIRAIINGTTNYILTKMSSEGLDFSTALAQAQDLGYAEADPSSDVEGIDAAYKLSILSNLGFHTRVRSSDVYHEGITHLTARDFRYAQELGYTIKLMALGRREGNHIQVRVHPSFVPQRVIMAKVDGAYNAIEIAADMVGQVFFHGPGAGSQTHGQRRRWQCNRDRQGNPPRRCLRSLAHRGQWPEDQANVGAGDQVLLQIDVDG